MDEQLSGSLGHIQTVFKEFINGDKRFLIKFIRSLAVKDLTDEHFAQGNGKLVDQTANAQLTVSYNISLLKEDPAYIQRHFGFLVGTADFFDLMDYSAICNTAILHGFLLQVSRQIGCRLLNFSGQIRLYQFFYYYNTVFIHCGDEIFAIISIICPQDLQYIIVFTATCFNYYDHSGHICLDMKLFGTAVDIHQEQVVQQEIFYKIILVKALLVSHQQILDLESSHLAHHIDILTVTAHYQYVLQL